MSKLQIFAVIAGLFAIVVGSYLFATHKSVSSIVEKKDTSILLYVQNGDVSYKNSEKGVFQKATTSPIVISNKSYVYTGIGAATILFPDNSSVVLDTYTELQVSYEDRKVSLYQTLGTTYHRVQTLLSGTTYEVETPGTLAAVRGTKFAVKYDKNKKTTKIAVTDHKVFVAKRDESGPSTASIVLEEGKTAQVDERSQPTGISAISVVATESDAEMKAWVDKNQKEDKAFDSLKQGTPETMRDSIKMFLLDGPDPKDVSDRKIDTTTEVNKEQDVKKTEEARPAKTDNVVQQKNNVQEVAATTTSVTKLGEEEFFNAFNELFDKYFYLDDRDTTCSLTILPENRVSKVSSFASASGYPFSSNTLLSFAQTVDAYCKNKTSDVKSKLRERFDIEYPFREDI